ncbi:MAG TPA: S8 family serine peptidase [Gemmataceae bacterium]|nr:S8 family serine peptidase [Gemmataceae bacterium]
MPRYHRMRQPFLHRSTLCLELLEDRQLLSASPVVPQPVPLMQHQSAPPPSDQPAGLTIFPAVGPAISPAIAAVYTPAQMRTAYGLNLLSNKGQGTTVAIVDAYNDPNITSDLSLFSSYFSLPQMNGVGSNPTFQILTPPGQATPPNPPSGSTWALETSLDVEWVHSIAPYANIDLVHTQNSSGDSLYAAEIDGQPYASGVGYAKTLPGVVVVSNSYGNGEFNGETFYDSQFTTPTNTVAFTFSTGDNGAPGSYPAYSPNVVAVGGTSLYTLSARGVYGSESGWSGGGGGVSRYEPTPAYQSSNGVNFGARSTPDISMDANPNTGVLVIDQYDFPGNFIEVGGTSLSAPMWAGLIALGDQSRIAGGGEALSSIGVLDALYGAYNSSSYLTDFHDVTTGNNGFAAGPGYDLVTGIGTPKAQLIVPLLAGAGGGAPTVQLGSGGTGSGQGINAGIWTNNFRVDYALAALSAPAVVADSSATSQSARSDAASVTAPVNLPLTAAAAVLPGGRGFLAPTMLSSGGGGEDVTDSSAPIDTTTNPVPIEPGQPTALAEGLSLPAVPGTPAVGSSIPVTGWLGVTDAPFASHGPLGIDGDPVMPLLPGVAAREDAVANLTGLAGMALVLGGACTGLTPRKAAVLRPSLRVDLGRRKS